jgi:hypothetical protein
MVVCRARKRHEDSGSAGGGDFGYGACAGTAQKQVCLGKGGRHGINKRMDFRHSLGFFVSNPGLIVVALAGLMDDAKLKKRLANPRQSLHHHAVDRCRTLAAAKDQ